METIIENIKDINYFELFSLKQDLDPDLEELDGGSLDLFEGRKDGTSKLVKSIIPKFNSLNMFEVSETSWHQVSEILADIQRLTLTGWYHV